MGALLVSPLTLCRSSSHHVDPALAADVHAQAFRDQLERVNPAPKVPDGRIESSKSVGGSSRTRRGPYLVFQDLVMLVLLGLFFFRYEVSLAAVQQ